MRSGQHLPLSADSSRVNLHSGILFVVYTPKTFTPTRAVVATAMMLTAGACSWDEPARRPPIESAGSPQTPISDPLATVIATARDQIGTPYRFGGQTPSGFDCSGLVHYAYRSVGVTTPRTTSGLWRQLPKRAEDIKPGDVLFFNIGGKPSHVGLYVGDGQFVHAPSTGRLVSVANLSDPYYKQAFIRAGRVMD